MLTRRLLVAAGLLSALVACTTDVVTRQEPGGPGADPNGGTTTDTDPTSPAKKGAKSNIAGVVSVDKISLYQGVEVRLVKDGAEVDKRNAPIITNRPALVRVHAKTDQAVGEVSAKLHVKIDGEETVIEDDAKEIQDYDDTSLDTTFNFKLSAEQVTSDLEFSVELVGAGDGDTVTFPADDQVITVGAEDAAKLRVQLVPVRYEADGSNRMPSLDAVSVKRYHDALYQMYPVSEVEITQHEPLDWDITVEPTGSGWDQLLNAVMTMRVNEEVDEDIYYIGVFNPASDIRQFCGGGGCILGIAPAAGFSDPASLDTRMELRSALVLGYQTSRSAGTISQELAHAMGRLHAPCGNPAAIDSKYPYKKASIGSSGWDPLSQKLVSGDNYSDFMSYCSPVWVSDYTWKAIFDRMSKVRDTMAKTQKSVKNIARPTQTQAFRVPVLDKEQIAWTTQPQ